MVDEFIQMFSIGNVRVEYENRKEEWRRKVSQFRRTRGGAIEMSSLSEGPLLFTELCFFASSV